MVKYVKLGPIEKKRRPIHRFWKQHPERKRRILGTMPDIDVAMKWGITRQRVQQLRNREGIPAWKNRHADKLKRKG